ncbi:MAG: T9SS type A sorting domain-containing protein [Bacteroidales bacterium]|nr:T9SS type A sorting domain-containing protein [Bacteroidales bacterium]
MKSFLFVFIIFWTSLVLAQTEPLLTWEKVLGGTSSELVGGFATISSNHGRHAVIDIDENGILYVASTTTSTDNDIASNSGEEDIFLMALDTLGNILWTKMLAGNSFERVHRVKARPDGGCIVVCNSSSDDGDFSTNHNSGYPDAAIFVYDSDGVLQWSKLYGGESIDYLYDIIFTSDGYWMACGEAISATGDLLGTSSGMQWVIKINPANGDIIWSKTFLGPDGANEDWIENAYRLVELSNQDVIITGYTTPNFNDFNLDRISIISISLAGNVNWMKKIGSLGSGDYPAAIVDNGSDSFYIYGRLQGTIGGEGDAANYYGGNGDAWIVKLDYSGNIVWEKNLGGTNLDMGYDMKINSEGYLYLAGMTRSTDNEASTTGYGLLDYWLLKLNENGDIIYAQKYGGSANDFATQMVLSEDEKKIFLIGGTESNDGNVTNYMGSRDVWLVRLDYPEEELPNYGMRDDAGVNLPEITYWFTDQASDIIEKAYEFDLNDFGTIDMLYLKGSSVKTWKSGDSDVTGAQFNYKVWKDGDTEPVDYTIRNIAWSSDDGDGNQTWADFGEEIPIITGLTPGDYFIKIFYTITGTGIGGILSNGPFVANFNIFDPSSDIISNSIKDDLKIYPNPASDYLYVETNTKESIKIYDMFGRIVEQVDLNNGNNSVDISALSSGVYTIKSNNNQIIRFIKK